VDFITPAWRELGRKLYRQWLRLGLWRSRRQLAAAETALGLLGWQQADFDPETQRQVTEIQSVEREQARFINEAAERAADMRRLRSELEALQRRHHEQRRGLAIDHRKAAEARADAERQLVEMRKSEPNFQRRIPELDRELRDVTKLLAELLRADHQTPKVRQEIVRLRERSVTIPNEKNDLRTQHFRIVSEIRALEEELDRSEAAAKDEARRLEAFDEEWSAKEREVAGRIKDQEREKARLEKRIAELERAKANPYQQIGQVLSLANLAPLNQPQALEHVKEIEFRIHEIDHSLDESRLASRGEDPRLLRTSCWAWAGLAAALGLVVYAAA
jgi:chromosome segregation ATPase